MSPNPPELTICFWHCAVAAKMTHDLEVSTVARAYRLHAVRKATDCWTGRNGIQFASTDAIERQSSQGTPWERSKLVKEHAVPVAVINSFVQQALRATPSDPGKVEPPQCLAEEVVMFPQSVATLFQQDPQLGRE